MRTRTKTLFVAGAAILALGAIAVIAGPTVYRGYLAPVPAETPLLMADEGTLSGDGSQLDATALTGSWSIAEGSEAGYRVNEVLNGTDVTVTGRTSEVEGTLVLDGLTLTDAEFIVDVASISTDSPQRDSYFRDSAVRASEHPTATFSLTEPLTAAVAPTSGETVELQVVGELTLAGATRQVAFSAQARTDGLTAQLAGQIPITFSDFGVTAPDLGFVSVEDSGFVEFALVAQKD